MRILHERERVKKGYEIERQNRTTGSDRIHFALASWSSDSDSAVVFSAARLHLKRSRNWQGAGVSLVAQKREVD
jgi:hypothetical protein